MDTDRHRCDDNPLGPVAGPPGRWTAGPLSCLRASGILLHVSSLPGPDRTGTFGPAAHRFADWLATAGQRYWQVLPLNPTDPVYGDSPYRSPSAFAINPSFVVHRSSLIVHRSSPLSFRRFCSDNAHWLDDYALYRVLKRKFHGLAWTDWPVRLRRREPAAIREVTDVFSDEVAEVRREQHQAHAQWLALRRHCNRLGIRIIGDMPIYVNDDSADVWAHPELFKLDRRGRPKFVAGVPPDYFSPTGQLWGNPLYRWREHARTGFAWWLGRVERQLALFDLVRIDHFRGLAGYWQVPAGEHTAERGRWVKAPGNALLAALRRRFPRMPFIAEDLGTITPDVERMRDRFGLPGTRVLQFGFSGPDNPHLPANVPENCVFYTGTHDNNTVRGWFEHDATGAEKTGLAQLLGRRPRPGTVSSDLARLVLASRARLAVLPLPDVLGLGQEARMNRPATTTGNWRWRVPGRLLTTAAARRLAELTCASGRANNT